MRVAVIAAPNPGYSNTGMLTVDLAAAGVLQRLVPGCSISWYTLHPPDEQEPVHRYVEGACLPFAWRTLIEHYDEVCDHDAILVWGDFQQARHYFVQDVADRLKRRAASPDAARDPLAVLYKHLLFADAPASVLRRVIVFGSSILMNRQTDYAADAYGAHVARLFRDCGGVWMRDPISAAKAQHLRAEAPAGCLGADAAFLLRDEDLACLPTTPWLTAPQATGRIGVFVGARTTMPRGFLRFLEELAARQRLELEWLPWFPVHEWLQHVPGRYWLNPAAALFVLAGRRRLRRLMRRGTGYSAGDLLGALRQYQFIVTDTYHLCVNAWRAGTPAVCFGNGDITPSHLTLADYKKQVLYDMFEARDFYFSTSDVRGASRRTRTTAAIQALMEAPSLAAAIRTRVHAHARRTEEALGAALSRVLRG